jgi:hypothetical protein
LSLRVEPERRRAADLFAVPAPVDPRGKPIERSARCVLEDEHTAPRDAPRLAQQQRLQLVREVMEHECESDDVERIVVERKLVAAPQAEVGKLGLAQVDDVDAPSRVPERGELGEHEACAATDIEQGATSFERVLQIGQRVMRGVAGRAKYPKGSCRFLIKLASAERAPATPASRPRGASRRRAR